MLVRDDGCVLLVEALIKLDSSADFRSGWLTFSQFIATMEFGMLRNLVTTIVLCMMLVPLIADAQALQMEITISKGVKQNSWLINYEFSEAIQAMKFDNTPYSFVESDWGIQTEGVALNLSLLQATFDTSGNQLSIGIKSENDSAVSGFYTPFLNFSDGSRAIFVGHYLPSELKVNNKWISAQNVEVSLTITPLKKEKILFDARHEVDKLSVSGDDTRQYVYIGRLPVKRYDKFNMLLDPALPAWAQESILKAIPQFYEYFEEKTQATLSFKPFFIINYETGTGKHSLDAGVINRQVAINFVGDGWNQNAETERTKVLSILAHEMAHLWNAQHWHYEGQNAVWMHEGGANYFSRKALLNFGYVSATEDAAYYNAQSKKCIEVLNGGAINDLQNRSDKYVCGEVIYKLSALMTSNQMHLDVWNNLIIDSDSLTYSEQKFIQALYGSSANRNEVAIIETALQKGSTDGFKALIEKYNRQHSYSGSIPPDSKTMTD